jgi:hypothetical protein
MKVTEKEESKKTEVVGKDGKEAGKEPAKETKDPDTLTFEGRSYSLSE